MTQQIKQARDAQERTNEMTDKMPDLYIICDQCNGNGATQYQIDDYGNSEYQQCHNCLARGFVPYDESVIRQDSINVPDGLGDAIVSWGGIREFINAKHRAGIEEPVRIPVYFEDINTLDLVLNASRELQRLKGLK